MPALSGFLWLISYWLIGEVVIYFTALPISSGVIGMLLLCVTLAMRGRVSSSIAAAAQPLIALLAMLIMPGVVGVFFIIGELAGQWSAILIALLLGTLLSVVTTLWLLKRLIKPTHVRSYIATHPVNDYPAVCSRVNADCLSHRERGFSAPKTPLLAARHLNCGAATGRGISADGAALRHLSSGCHLAHCAAGACYRGVRYAALPAVAAYR